MVKEKRDGESPLYYAMSAKKQKNGIFLNETKNKQHENEIPKETYNNKELCYMKVNVKYHILSDNLVEMPIKSYQKNIFF